MDDPPKESFEGNVHVHVHVDSRYILQHCTCNETFELLQVKLIHCHFIVCGLVLDLDFHLNLVAHQENLPDELLQVKMLYMYMYGTCVFRNF